MDTEMPPPPPKKKLKRPEGIRLKSIEWVTLEKEKNGTACLVFNSNMRDGGAKFRQLKPMEDLDERGRSLAREKLREIEESAVEYRTLTEEKIDFRENHGHPKELGLISDVSQAPPLPKLQPDTVLTAADILFRDIYPFVAREGREVEVYSTSYTDLEEEPLHVIRIGPKIPEAQRKFIHKQSLRAFESMINGRLSNSKYVEAPLKVENTIDYDLPPFDFNYITDYVCSYDVDISDQKVFSCDCEEPEPEPESAPSPAPSRLTTSSSGREIRAARLRTVENSLKKKPKRKRTCGSAKCCPQAAGMHNPYDYRGRLLLDVGHSIFECNRWCICSPNCRFRVVQKLRKIPMTIYKTRDKGWAVRTNVAIPAGTFISEYTGEIITTEDAEKRSREIYEPLGTTYVLDMCYQVEDDNKFSVDAFRYGNAMHFANHSCAPNMRLHNVYVDSLVPELPRVAFFAARDIPAGEELTFDYANSSLVRRIPGIPADAVEAESAEVTEVAGAESADDAVDLDSAEVAESESSSREEEYEDEEEGDERMPRTEVTPEREECSEENAEEESGEIEDSEKGLLRRKPGSKRKFMKCLCGTPECRQYIFM